MNKKASFDSGWGLFIIKDCFCITLALNTNIIYGGRAGFPLAVVSWLPVFVRQYVGFVPQPPPANKNKAVISTSFHSNPCRWGNQKIVRKF